MSDADYCKGCCHELARHYRDVKKVVRCLVVERGTSSRGIIGIPYEHECDCRNYKSAAREKVLRETRAEQRRNVEDIQETMRRMGIEPVKAPGRKARRAKGTP